MALCSLVLAILMAIWTMASVIEAKKANNLALLSYLQAYRADCRQQNEATQLLDKRCVAVLNEILPLSPDNDDLPNASGGQLSLPSSATTRHARRFAPDLFEAAQTPRTQSSTWHIQFGLAILGIFVIIWAVIHYRSLLRKRCTEDSEDGNRHNRDHHEKLSGSTLGRHFREIFNGESAFTSPSTPPPRGDQGYQPWSRAHSSASDTDDTMEDTFEPDNLATTEANEASEDNHDSEDKAKQTLPLDSIDIAGIEHSGTVSDVSEHITVSGFDTSRQQSSQIRRRRVRPERSPFKASSQPRTRKRELDMMPQLDSKAKFDSKAELDTQPQVDRAPRSDIKAQLNTIPPPDIDTSQFYGRAGLNKTAPPDIPDPARKSDFEVQGRSFFAPGRVFRILWFEPKEQADTRPTRDESDEYGENHHVRRFVVVKSSHGSCVSVPINSYGGRGLAKRGLTTEEVRAHAIIHDANHESELLDPKQERASMMKPPIPIRTARNARLDPTSRVRFDMPYMISHGVKVRNIGMVQKDHRDRLLQYFREANQPVYSSNEGQVNQDMLDSSERDRTPRGRQPALNIEITRKIARQQQQHQQHSLLTAKRTTPQETLGSTTHVLD